jgi:heme-degrading monooxygenase HmoA/ubiquinone/menaquinone biosynthesis C-methylase UbiE
VIVKAIEVRPRPGHLDAYLASQRIWDEESRAAPGYLGTFCGRDPREPDLVHVLIYWRSREDYDAWMAREHDRIAALAGAAEHIERMTIRVLDGEPDPLAVVPPGILPEETLEAADVALWSEAYRCTAALRVAVQLKLFDRLGALGDEPTPTTVVATRLGVQASVLERVLTVLQAMGFTHRHAGGWALTPLAARTLRTDAPAYQGHMVMYNSRPALLRRWWGIGDELGVEGLDREPDAAAVHELFVRAMSDTAHAGQATALAESVDLQGVGHVLDVGGGAGEYAVALCQAFPFLRATVLDLPATEPLARAVIDASPVAARIAFTAGDYREGPWPGPVDAVLFSNILRGETPASIDDLLGRALRALTPRGLVVIHDLLPEDPPAPPGLRAALFGLHLPQAANPTAAALVSALERAGFVVEDVRRLRRSAVANRVIVARKRRVGVTRAKSRGP